MGGGVVGSLVVLAPDFASYSDASGGPLSLGQVGVVVQTSSARLQVKVKPSGDRVWWYVVSTSRYGACVVCACEEGDARRCIRCVDAVTGMTSRRFAWRRLRAPAPDAPPWETGWF